MVYIPKKTLHVRHEGVTSGSQTRCNGRWLWGTSEQMYDRPGWTYAYAFTQNDQTAHANLTGTREEDGNIPFVNLINNLPRTWGFPQGTFKIEYEALMTLNSTADPAEYRYTTDGNSINYSPQLVPYSSLESRKLNLRWIDYTENSTNYRLYKQEFTLTSTPRYTTGHGWNDAVNFRFYNALSSGGNEILTMPFEDIKITQLD